MTETRQRLWDLVRPLVYVGWGVAVTRFALDMFAPEHAEYIGVYYVMPAVLLVCGIRKRFAQVSFARFSLAMVMVAALVWALPNIVTYTVGQFMEWDHGRFAPGQEVVDAAGDVTLVGQKAAPHAESTLGKIRTGALVGAATGLGGIFWMFVWGVVVAWLPSRRGGKTEST